MLQPVGINDSQRPSKLSAKKDDSYHLQMASAIIREAFTTQHQEWVIRCMVNWAFYQGKQWLFNEDLEMFFMDESGGARNRIKMVQNIVQPALEYHRGNTIRMDFTTEVKSLSKESMNRRETSLNNMLFVTDVAGKVNPILSDGLKDGFAIGNTKKETEDLHGNLYIDKYEETMTLFQDKVAQDNDFDEIKNQLISNIFLDGMGINRCMEWAGEQVWKRQNPWNFFFDRTAQKPDLSDGDYMGSWDLWSVTSIFEKYQNINPSDREIIENGSRFNMQMSYQMHSLFNFNKAYSTGKIPVYNVCWRDGEFQEYGYIRDINGYIYLTRVNDKDEQEGYTDKDLVTVDEIPGKSVFPKNKVKGKIWVDLIRYCDFIPSTEIGFSSTRDHSNIILDYGVLPYQPKQGYSANNIQFPYKAYCWSYNDGEVRSPCDALIDPQRQINRLNSIAESHINNAGGSGSIYDKDMVDARDGEQSIEQKMKNGQPIGLRAKGNLNNSLGTYDNGIKQGTFAIYDIAEKMKAVSAGIQGGGEALTGGGGAYRATGSVYDAAISQGNIMQEPIYYCVNKIILQSYQEICRSGLRIYVENPRELAINVGDQGARLITLTKDYLLEDFRAEVVRVQSKNQEITQVNGLLFQLMQYQVLDGSDVAALWNNGSMSDVGRAMREFDKKKQQAIAMKEARDQQANAVRANAQTEMIGAQQGLQNMQDDKETILGINSQDKELQNRLEQTVARKIIPDANKERKVL